MKNIKNIFFILAAMLVFSTASYAQHGDHDSAGDEPVGKEVAGGTLYGTDIKADIEVISFDDLMSKPADYDGKEVVVMGTVSDVCQKMGCWLTMTSGSNTTRIKTSHEFFVPKGSAGQTAVVQGTFKIKEISEKMARHYNDESKTTTIKTEDIVGPQKGFELDATGIKFLTPEQKTENK
jgi:hypothetical protein